MLYYKGEQIVASAFGSVKNQQVTLDTLQVNLCERGMGLGSCILGELKHRAISLGCTHIVGNFRPESDPQETKRFYNKNGFEVDPNTGQIYLELEATPNPSAE